MIFDEILKRVGLKYEELTPEEQETLHSWVKTLGEKKLTIENVREYVVTMRDQVELSLTKAKLGSKKDMFLKARLRNYMLLEAFLSTPEKAKAALERTIAGVAGKKES